MDRDCTFSIVQGWDETTEMPHSKSRILLLPAPCKGYFAWVTRCRKFISLAALRFGTSNMEALWLLLISVKGRLLEVFFRGYNRGQQVGLKSEESQCIEICQVSAR